MLRRRWLWTPIVLVAIAAGSYVAYRALSPKPLPAGVFYGNGRIEGTEVTVSSQVEGRVLTSALVEGGRVRAGDVLVRIDPSDFETRLARARAQEQSARNDEDRLQRELAVAEHHLMSAQRDDARFAALARKGAVAEVQREEAANALAAARGRIATLQAASQEAAARAQALEDGVALAQVQLGRTVVTAPISGTILDKSIEVGELAAPGRPIATLVDLAHVKLKIYVDEKDIGRLRLGDEARVRTDAFPGRLIGARLSRIDSEAQFTPRDIHMPNERIRLVFGVTLAIDNADGVLKPGMPVDAWVRWQPATAWPAIPTVPQ